MFWGLRQKHKETNTEYLSQLSLRHWNTVVLLLVTQNFTGDEAAKLSHCLDRMLACHFVLSADPSCYKLLQADLVNSFAKKANWFPTSVQEGLRLLSTKALMSSRPAQPIPPQEQLLTAASPRWGHWHRCWTINLQPLVFPAKASSLLCPLSNRVSPSSLAQVAPSPLPWLASFTAFPASQCTLNQTPWPISLLIAMSAYALMAQFSSLIDSLLLRATLWFIPT